VRSSPAQATPLAYQFTGIGHGTHSGTVAEETSVASTRRREDAETW
jgi:hypothetical protein